MRERKKQRSEQYQTFCDTLKVKILSNSLWNIMPEDYRFYPEGYSGGTDAEEREFVYQTNRKYYGIESEILAGDFISLHLRTDGESICMCRFSLEYLFAEYQQEGWEKVEFILQENIMLAQSSNLDFIFEHFSDYEFMKQRLMMRCINYDEHKLELQPYVYKVYGDIAVVLYARLYDDYRGLGAIKIPREILLDWGMDEEVILEDALIHTYAYAQPRLYTNLWDTIKTPVSKGAFMSVNSDMESIEKFQVPLITTTKKMNGAIAIFYPGVKEKIAKLFGASYYVAFTSIHEARLHHCDSVSPKLVARSLLDVNDNSEKEEILSRYVFYYDADKKTLEPCLLENM